MTFENTLIKMIAALVLAGLAAGCDSGPTGNVPDDAAGEAIVQALDAATEASATTATIDIDSDDIAGIVTSATGPEAGVWVIAETDDLGTRFSRIVVTDDEGRYLLRISRTHPIRCG